MMDTVDLERLKAVVIRLLDEAISELGSTTLKLDHSFYWTLSPDEQFDTSRRPFAEDVGNLRDDWEMLQWLATESRKVSAYV